MYDFVRIAVCVPKTAVGNVKKNTKEILEKITLAQNKNADFALFPELALTGHSAGDMLFFEDTLKNVKAGINEIVSFTENKKIVVVFGSPVEIDGTLLNCALVVSDGRICAIVPKSTLGAYGSTFDTKYFTSSAISYG
jgi:NAD+ synthase (glutamine-hydrolysing)